MQPTAHIWQNGQFVPWQEANTHVLSHGLHYGSGVFEGIRCYETPQGSAIFKLAAHVARLVYSANALGMQLPYSEAELCQAITDTVAKNRLQAGYIRPLAYYGYGALGVMPSKELPIEVVIACWPWADYLEAPAVDIKISDFIRIHPQSSVADAKICGHYVNSLLARTALRDTHYHEALLLDHDGFVAEGSAENIFIVREGHLITTPLGTILPGITRATVMEMAANRGYAVSEERFTPAAVLAADEAFFCGTAVEIVPIRSLDDQLIGNGEPGLISQQLQQAYQAIVHDKDADFMDALTRVNFVAGV